MRFFWWLNIWCTRNSTWKVSGNDNCHKLNILLACDFTQSQSYNCSYHKHKESKFNNTLKKWLIIHELFVRDKRTFEVFDIWFNFSYVFWNIVHLHLELFKLSLINIGLFNVVDGITKLTVALRYLPSPGNHKTQQTNKGSKCYSDSIIFECEVHSYGLFTKGCASSGISVKS